MEQENIKSIISDNKNYVSDSTFMIFRTDTQSLIRDIKNYLSAKETRIIKNEDGDLVEVDVQIGIPFANEEGILKICNLIRMSINQHTAQGSIKLDHYYSLIERFRKEVSETIISKCYEWDIQDEDLNPTINEICRLFEIFMTRAIDNKEREGYSMVQRINESSTVGRNDGVLSKMANFTRGNKA